LLIFHLCLFILNLEFGEQAIYQSQLKESKKGAWPG